ncbi:carbonic anhydrase [Mycolicibacterium elephantis]
MSFVTELSGRNEQHAATHRGAVGRLAPTRQAILITCCDHRVDPAYVLGLQLDEAVVIRNAGGRVNADVIRTMAALATVAHIEALELDVEVIVMHHTDCGTSRFTTPELAPFAAELLGVQESEVGEHCLDDPREAVRVDVRRLSRDPLVPAGMPISGLVYDVGSGRAEVIVTARGECTR